MTLLDNEEKYGLISRLLHWGMAVLMLWQFATTIAHIAADDTPVEQFLWSTHKPLGLILLVLIALRVLWALANHRRRPPAINAVAKLGHVVLYGMLLAIPALALLRQYGTGRAFEPFGLPLFTGFEGDKVTWMIEPGNVLHGFLGWVMLAMIVGHVLMVRMHRRLPNQLDVLPRML